MLRKHTPVSRPRCSQAPRGLFVLSWVTRIFTGTSISPSPLSRQRSSRYSLRAGRNLPDKEFLLPKVRGQFAEFLNRGSLVHLWAVTLAYRCRCAVRAHQLWLEAFLGGLAHVTSVPLLALVPAVMPCSSGFPYWRHSGLATHPVPSMGSRYLPRPLFAHASCCGAGLSNLLSIAYDYYVLGLGPD